MGRGGSLSRNRRTKGLVAKGKASFQLGSNPNNHALINATASGPFQFGVTPQGNMTFKITRGKSNFKLGSYAGGPLAGGGIGGLVTGNFSLTQFTDSSISAQAQGSAYLSVQIGGSTTTTTTANTITVLSNKLAMRFTRDSAGHLRFRLAGNSTINGDFNKSSAFDVFG